ncbi:MAG: M28 family metallopeptidase [Gammaproteobacteria bacterium]
MKTHTWTAGLCLAAVTAGAMGTGRAADDAVDSAAAGITAAELAGMTRAFSADEMEGRAPGTPGGRRAVAWLEEQFREAGLKPAWSDGYRQPVELVEVTPDFSMRMRLGPETLSFGGDFVAWTRRVTPRVTVEDSELVFAGYGIVAPEYGWNDWEGVDWAGKTAVVLVNDPGFASGDPELFTGRAMTYYGRWTYKYEEAARQGAEGLIIIHETAPAAYGWSVVESSWSRPQSDLVQSGGTEDRAKLEGWITREVAGRMFQRAGLDFAAMKEAALAPDFAPVPLDQAVSIQIDNTIRRSTSYNVAGVIPGSKRPDEHLVYVAHWDHLGQDPSLEGDTIYNGAADNATGVASLLEIARAFRATGRAPERTVVFLSVTAEEQGLLGARRYAADPLVPPGRMVAALGMDIMARGPASQDAVLIGLNQSELGDLARAAAAVQGRGVRPHPSPESGYFYRSDHFAFVQQGVPALLFLNPGAPDSEYVTQHYHRPSDEYRDDWDLSGAVADARLFFRIGWALANDDRWPAWRDGSEFRAVREASR